MIHWYYIAAPLVAAGAGLWYAKKHSMGGTVKKPVSSSPPPTMADACAAGTTDGSVDASNDTGGPSVMAGKLLNYSTDPTIQAEYVRCYGLAYSGKYIAPTSTISTDTVPSDGKGPTPADAAAKAHKDAVRAAFMAGCSNGGASGWKDAANGIEDKPTPSHSHFSDADANNAYVYSFTKSYEIAYASRDKFSSLPGWGEGENTVWDGTGLSECQSNFETWYTSHATSGWGTFGFRDGATVAGAMYVGHMVAGIPGAVVGGALAAVGSTAHAKRMMDQHVGATMRSVVPIEVRRSKLYQHAAWIAPHVGATATGFMVAGVPGAAVAGLVSVGATEGGTVVDRVKRVAGVAVAGFAGLFVAGIPGAAVAGLAAVGAMRGQRHVDHQRIGSDLASGKLSVEKAKHIATALDARGDHHAAAAVRSEIAVRGVVRTGAHGVVSRDRRATMMKRMGLAR